MIIILTNNTGEGDNAIKHNSPQGIETANAPVEMANTGCCRLGVNVRDTAAAATVMNAQIIVARQCRQRRWQDLQSGRRSGYLVS